ncbi:hypothetical protein NUW58_g4870 [Xylaria curta]|uniref:Uncharacterized protein n=1 Tax=Xylaria curta TaxID=42375 RepID=A0ACC1P5Z9_9PEZI|nr:hypothetical protein NUW58_g4870 [Xylaria curta]
MPPAKKKSQARLTFETIGGSSSSPVSTYSPARVRYSRAAHSSPVGRMPSIAAPSSSAQVVRRSGRRKPKQSKLGGSIAPPASFMPKLHSRRNRVAVPESSDDSAAEIGDAGYDEGDDVDLLPPSQKASELQTSENSGAEDSDDEPNIRHPRSSQSVSTRLQRTILDDDDDDDDDNREGSGDKRPEPSQLSSPCKRRHSSVISLDDSDDAPILLSASARKLSRHTLIELDDSEDDIVSVSKKRKIFHHSSPSVPSNNRTPGRLKRPGVVASSPIKKAHKGHRSEKQKKMELLRRRRAGEKIEQLTASESSSNEDGKRGIYDSDPECDFEVLKKFDDEEEEEVVEEQSAPRGDKRKPKHDKPTGQGGDESDLDDFVTDDDDAPLGAPVDIPLEFTSNAHMPLKDQFPFVIEWLVHNRINPAFERKDPVYLNAWRKLDDEVTGLANSKFTSSAWKIGEGLYDTCEACGRSGHPSTYKIIFSGSAYHKDTLAEVESDSDAEGDDDEADNDTASVDTRGMPLPPVTKEWCVGSVCCSNAETAHSLLHWRYALKQWVEERLEDEGWMAGDMLSQRERMKAKKRRALANKIVDGWQEGRRRHCALW